MNKQVSRDLRPDAPSHSTETPAIDRFGASPSRNFGAGGPQGTRARLHGVGPAMWLALRPRLTVGAVLFCANPESVALGEVPGLRGVSLAPSAGWMDANLSDPVAIEAVEREALVAPGSPQLVGVAGVLEVLADPRPLLRMLRRRLKQHPDSRLVLATAERGRPGAPDPDATYRQWTQRELCAFLEAAGFEVVQAVSTLGAVAITELRCSPGFYAEFLARHCLPPANPRLMLLDAAVARDGHREASVVLEQFARVAGSVPLVLVVFAARGVTAWLRAEELAYWDNPWLAPNGVLDAVLQLVFLYDGVQEILFADLGGAFFRVPQAKRAGLLPPSITCAAICLGNNAYAEHRAEAFQDPDRNLTHLWEKVAFELADVAVFPGAAMQSFYRKRFRPLGQALVRPPPFHFAQTPPPAGSEPADTLAVVGTPDNVQRWTECLAAVAEVVRAEGAVRHVVLLGRPKRAALPRFPSRICVRELGPAADSAALLRAVAPRGVAVLLGGPFTVLEALDVCCPFLAAQGDGAEELIPEPDHASTIIRPRAALWVPALRRALGPELAQGREQVAAMRQAVVERFAEVNRSWHALLPAAAPYPARSRLDVTIVIPVYNRPLAEILDAVEGIANQTLLPREVIFVDDASAEPFEAAHGAQLNALLPVSARYIRHNRNRGLSGARNTGLAACRTPYVAMHDTDNVAAADFLYRGCLTLERNAALDAVTFMASVFRDGEDWRRHDAGRETYYPIGDGVILSLSHINWFGDAMGVYRTAALRELGGWDETSRAMWEDLALFATLVSSGRRMMTVPRVEVFYRIRPDSMLRTESEFDARQRLARSLRGLSVFDVLCLQRIVLAQMRGNMPVAFDVRQHIFAAIRLLVRNRPLLAQLAHRVARLLRRTRVAWNNRRL
jgi:GT2 family glycosyltransferase